MFQKLYYLYWQNYQTIFVARWVNRQHPHILARHVPFVHHLLYCFHTTWFTLISFWCETRYWGTTRLRTFCLNKLRSRSVTLSLNALPLITFNYAFHKPLTKPNLCTNFTQSHLCANKAHYIICNFYCQRFRYILLQF